MKRLVIILFLALVGALYCDWAWLEAQLAASAQARRPAPNTQARSGGPVDYSKFKHSTHKDKVKTRKGDAEQLDCAYCHGQPTKEQPDVLQGYPSKKYAVKTEMSHSACLDCHAIGGPEAMKSGLCSICHQNPRPSKTSQQLKPFPNPAVIESQFYDFYSHSDHTGYAEASDVFQEKFKDKKKFKEKDNFECAACHVTNKEKVTVAAVSFAPGVRETAPGHPECFVCHFNEKEVRPNKPTFATNCVGCHVAVAKTAGKGSELAVHEFVRQIVNTEKNVAKPGGKPLKPFSHKTHENFEEIGGSKVDVGTKTCLECHATGKRAAKRSDFFLEDRRTKEKQPRAGNCTDCHKTEMQQKIGGTVKLDNSKCLYCHALPTLKEKAASGLALPPPSHFPKPKATPTPTPAAKPDAKPPEAPAPKPETKTETKPAPSAPKPESPTVRPESPKPEPAKPTPPAAAEPAAASRALPAKLVLGDPKVSPHWGRDRGVVAFDHTTHIQPAYAERCEVCHHTNKDARKEAIPKCVECHKEEGNPSNAKNKAGEEVDVKTAYHGSPDNQTNNAGCIECHKRYYDRNPDRERKVTSKCEACHAEKQASLRPSWLRASVWTRHALRLAGH